MVTYTAPSETQAALDRDDDRSLTVLAAVTLVLKVMRSVVATTAPVFPPIA